MEMNFDLLASVSQFKPFHDEENHLAWFKTLVPWVAPEAYLNIIYKPAAPAVLKSVAEKWRFPAPLISVLSMHNGALLFSTAMNLYGVVAPPKLLNRQDRFLVPPFDIERENQFWPLDRDRLLVIGGYRLGFRVCIDRNNCRVYAFHKKGPQLPVASWDSIEHWLNSEILRLAKLFDNEGRRIGPESETGPPAQ
jgi:hypothetical protein